jgi:hypothetical protein
MTSDTTRTATTACATGSGRRRFAPAIDADRKNSRVRDPRPAAADQVAEVGQLTREQCLAELRRTLQAPAWAAAIAAMGQPGGAA